MIRKITARGLVFFGDEPHLAKFFRGRPAWRASIEVSEIVIGFPVIEAPWTTGPPSHERPYPVRGGGAGRFQRVSIRKSGKA